MKAVLAVRHGVLPPTLHFSTPNPHITFEKRLLRQRSIAPLDGQWSAPRGGQFLRPGRHNVHMLVEQAPPLAPAPVLRRRPRISYCSQRAVAKLCVNSSDDTPQFLVAQPDVNLHDLCFTANTSRTPMRERLALVFSNYAELRDGLAEFSRTGATSTLAGPRIYRATFGDRDATAGWAVEQVVARLAGSTPAAVARPTVVSGGDLTAIIAQQLDAIEAQVATPPLALEERLRALSAVAVLFAAGANVDWQQWDDRALAPPYRLAHVSLPASTLLAWTHQRYPLRRPRVSRQHTTGRRGCTAVGGIQLRQRHCRHRGSAALPRT